MVAAILYLVFGTIYIIIAFRMGESRGFKRGALFGYLIGQNPVKGYADPDPQIKRACEVIDSLQLQIREQHGWGPLVSGWDKED